MQGYGNGINAYRQAQVGTADPRRLVIMCYENVIKQLALAGSAYESGDYEAKGRALARAYDTIELLLQSLNFEGGGEIALKLQSIYTYSLRRLSEADLKKDFSAFREITGIFLELLASWKDLSSNPGSGKIKAGSRGAEWGTAAAEIARMVAEGA